ncbi:IS1 family transposase [Parasediminibacterium sp. JCM 36343]|uniref:IS1/IS1595 family N-terminal zinc-binding domain-containing protein n=1 Tax=Parasediminibacterium sp. JCM 36343 TaxID=3374279 RepID=UPI003978A4BB
MKAFTMLSVLRICHNCQSPNIIKNGKNASNQQRYRCKDCNVTRVLDYRQPSRVLDMEQVALTYTERGSFRSTGRIFDVSHVSILRWLKKSPVAARF